MLTTAPNDLLVRVHDRMPVVIPDGLEQAWLESVDGPPLRALEPLMAPWAPTPWEAVKLEAGAPAAVQQAALDQRHPVALDDAAGHLPAVFDPRPAHPTHLPVATLALWAR